LVCNINSFIRASEALNVLLYEMSWQEAKEYFANNDVAILPVGSNEQHGPQNPLGTDYLIAKALAEETAKRTSVVCLPVIPFGVSSHHKHLCGTIFIAPRIFKEYVKEVCSSLKYYNVRKVVIVNGHGGNRCALVEMARELREENMFISVFQWWEASAKLLPNIFQLNERGHAGGEETSMNLTLHPKLVKTDKAVDEEPRRHIAKVEGLTLPLYTVDETSSGVYGKSTTASATKGKEILETVVGELVKHVEMLKRTKIEDLIQKK